MPENTSENPKQSYSLETKEKAFRQWVDGKKYQEIADSIGAPYETVSTWYTNHGWKSRLDKIKQDLIETGIVGILEAGNIMLKTTIESAPIVHKLLWDIMKDEKSTMIDRKRAAETLEKLGEALKIFVPELKAEKLGLSGRTVNPSLIASNVTQDGQETP